MARRARDGAIYVRVQRGHSLLLCLFMCCFVVGIPFLIYYTLSPNHYWHL